MKYLKQFEDIRIFGLKNHKFQRGAAITIPGIGIFVEKNTPKTWIC